MKAITIALTFALFSTVVHATQFVVKYKDKTDIEWSQNLGRFSNGCVNENDKMDSTRCTYLKNAAGEPILDPDGHKLIDPNGSNAAQACIEIGGRLPNRHEQFILLQEFDHISSGDITAPDSPVLSKLGRTQFLKYFDDMVFELDPYKLDGYWIASLQDDNTAYAFLSSGLVGVSFRGFDLDNIRCVR